MKQSKKAVGTPMRLAALALAVVLTVVLAPSLGTKASAFTSLNHIESIKANQSTFNIVEIVPQANTGSIGYYVDGCEPTSNYWMTQVAAGTTRTARANIAQTIFTNLQARGILGNTTADTSCPLTYFGDYAEYYPWESATGATTLTLNKEDTVQLSNSQFTYTGINQGAFKNNSNATYRGSSGGYEYAQNIDHFVYVESTDTIKADTANYYYNIGQTEDSSFIKIDFNDSDINTTLKELADSVTAIYTPVYKTGSTTDVDYYVYAGTLGAGFMLNVNEAYYYVDTTKIGNPYTGSTATAATSPMHYYAVANSTTPYVQVTDKAKGCFSMDLSNYEYVGENHGDYKLETGTDTLTVTYSTIKVAGGYKNNDWLLRYVFDAEDDAAAAVKAKMKIQVFSVCPNTGDSVITDNINKLLSAADLVVLSDGLNLSDGGKVGGYSTSGQIDLTSAQITTLTAMQKAGTAILLDGRIANESAASNLKTFASTAMSGQTASFVSGSVYGFVPETTARLAIATKDFPAELSGYTDTTSPYYDVYNEITYENFLRTTANKDTTDLLPTKISMANCLRYIVNYSGQRVENKKDSVKVLDVEPLTQETSYSGCLSQSTVAAWLKDSGISASNITITTMSTAEFISKIEDINEVYDLVYIGASTDNFSLQSDGTPQYRDTTMNGMFYTNIGDTCSLSGMYVGMMDSDYSGSVNDSRSYRLSGKDITPAKVDELKNFAQSGFPIIVSDGLLSAGHDATPAYPISVSLTGAYSRGYLTLNATVTTDATGTFEYNWYRTGDDQPVAYASRTASKTNSVTISDPDEGTYYCTVTLQGKMATSNAITLGKVYNASVYDSDDENTVTIQPIEITGEYNRSKYGKVNHYEVSVADFLGTSGISYQWQYKTASGWKNYTETGSVTSTINVDYTKSQYADSVHFRCKVTINGTDYYSKSIYYRGGGFRSVVENGSTTYELSVVVNSFGTASGAKLTAVALTNPSLVGATYAYQWYSYEEDLWSGSWEEYSTDSTIENITSGYYYCTVSLKGQNSSAQSKTYYVSYQLGVTVNPSGGTTVTIPATEATDATVNGARVDNCSNMYTALSTLLPYANVMTATEAGKQTNTLLKYLNLSKPSINFTAKPKEYTVDTQLGNSLIDNNQLVYTFTINNPTEATPLTTRYSCQLYLDRNADGRYKSSEEISDLLIKDGDGNVVEANQLAAGRTYTVTRKLPGTYSGIIPWQLKITKIGADQIHTSQTGYTYLQPAAGKATVIKVLQITAQTAYTTGWGGTDYYTFSLDTTDTTYQKDSMDRVAEQEYLELFKELRDAGLYDIQVTTKTVADVNKMSSDQINTLFTGKDMLLLGFSNLYGGNDGSPYSLSSTAASAVVSFIKSGNAVLFTHDTTSFANLPERYRSSYSQYWGYYFNSIIRDAVGLDRYGVTNTTFGISKYAPNYQASTYSDLVSSGYNSGTLTSAQAKLLTDAKYSIAYKPGSGKSATVAQPQGVIDLRLKYSGFMASSSVSQVNKGQITTYPYNINTRDFGNIDAGSTLTIGDTHQQYYQLNMNSDDTVVWFCLSGGTYSSDYKNDGVNAYYIYNKGNVTYSGAGHSPKDTTEIEAKLFVNTMIAAYRSAAVDPTFDFKSSDDQPVTSQFVPMEYTEIGKSMAGTAVENTKIYFKISDTNLTADKTVGVQFYYQLGDGTLTEIKSDLVIHRADTGAVVAAANVHSDTLYYFTLSNSADSVPPDPTSAGSVLSIFAGSSESMLSLQGKVTTTIGTKDYIGISTMTLQKLGFMSLR